MKVKLAKKKPSLVLKNTIIYTLMELVKKGLPFLLLPIMTRYLSQSDYGVLAIFNSFISIAAIFISLNAAGAVGVNYFHLNKFEFPKRLPGDMRCCDDCMSPTARFLCEKKFIHLKYYPAPNGKHQACYLLYLICLWMLASILKITAKFLKSTANKCVNHHTVGV